MLIKEEYKHLLDSTLEEYKVKFFDLRIESNKEDVRKLLDLDQSIVVHDAIEGQIAELLKGRNPKTKFTQESLYELVDEELEGTNKDEYGVWVYYPWSKRLVHTLREDDFIEIRTNRNNYKITPEERTILAQKKIGIIGLSVGQSIALTMAQERIFGELRIADFDILEMSNLNRIRSGLHNLDLPKVYMVAREIAEIDPYLEVKCYPEGLNDDNMDDFFLEGGKLDIVLDECDGLDIKITCRHKAKELGVPVLMESSDRGTTDIERFDLDPNLPILHGLIDHLDLSKVREAKTNEEKVPYLLPMLGVDTASTRLKASMLEIEQSITTWPQLASGVVIGGGICTDVARRILLDQFRSSGRYFVDVEDIITETPALVDMNDPLNIKESISDDFMRSEVQKGFTNRISEAIELTEDVSSQLIEAASTAPSGANAQTWKWLIEKDAAHLFFDDIFRPDLLDCRRTTMITGLGCAAENFVLKAHELGYEVKMHEYEIDDSTSLICSFQLIQKQPQPSTNGFEPHAVDYLSKSIPFRVSNRNIEKSEKIAFSNLEQIKASAASIEGAELLLITEKEKLKTLAEITGKMDRLRYISKNGHNDFRGEARWTKEDAELTRNGISFTETMDLTPTEFAGFYVSKDWSVVRHLADWQLGTAYEKIQRKWILHAEAAGLLIMPEFSERNFFDGGRALQRAWLEATNLEIDSHPPSLSTLIFNSVQYGPEGVLPPIMMAEAKKHMKDFEDLFGISEKPAKILLMRFFKGSPPKYQALRYPLDQIMRK